MLNSNIIGGDLNNHNLGLDRTNVYHTKNIVIKEIIDLKNNKISDHPFIYGTTILQTKYKENQRIIEIYDKEKVFSNDNELLRIAAGETENIRLQDSKIKRTIMREDNINDRKYWFAIEDFEKL